MNGHVALWTVCSFYVLLCGGVLCRTIHQREVMDLVEKWSSEIGQRLKSLSETMTREAEVERSFKPLEEKLVEVNGAVLTEAIARDIRILMDDKTRAVKSIADYAEFLSYYRKNESDDFFQKYFYFNADAIASNERDLKQEDEIARDICQAECAWWCHQRELEPIRGDFTKEDLIKLFNITSSKSFKGPSCGSDTGCECTNRVDEFRGQSFFENLPMQRDDRFDDDVNFNVSVLKIATNVYHRERGILEGVKWSEALDFVFKYNFAKDPELTWQYFASPRGFMRHYPAVKWSDERYDKTYDFRTRSWYTEAMTSPKDMVILLDKSGSMMGMRKALSHQIVNDILDTLNDNDFVNIILFNNVTEPLVKCFNYTLVQPFEFHYILDTLNDNDFVNIILFNNVTEPLVKCFNYTLVQANEENLRLLRENLPVYMLENAADLTVGMKKAFQILETFRDARTSSNCNQAIMLITEGIDYTFDIQVFNTSNWMRDFPVRVFTYLLGSDENDAKQMEYIACANMGWYVNSSLLSDVREKVLNYLNVMSRPVNMHHSNRQVPIWSYLYVDLADRRLSNWLWRKYEGIRQREVFLDHVKRDVLRKKKIITGPNYMLLKRTHEYEKYEKKQNYKYMTTVSLPVYGRRKDETELIGVAGIDVPIKLFKSRIPYDILGVNGYAFIVTNNGYVIMHPDHRTEFEDILKPTFNRVDILETEILDNDADVPRRFSPVMERLREIIVDRDPVTFRYTLEDVFRNGIVHDRKLRDPITLRVKYTLNDMKRVMKVKNHYYFAPIGPFTLGIVLPDKYGFIKFNVSTEDVYSSFYNYLVKTQTHWKVHPDWTYVKCECKCETPEQKIIVSFLPEFCKKKDKLPLYYKLVHDINITRWFDSPIKNENRFIFPYQVHKVFLATWNGLTRYKTFNRDIFEADKDSFETRNNRATGEDWYKRAVEENFKNESNFIYSVPFEISGYEDNTMITSVKAVFIEKGSIKTPVAVVGLQFNHKAMFDLYKNITTKCYSEGCRLTCESNELQCFILDKNAYIVLSDEIEHTGRFMGDIRPDIMYYLIKEEVYDPTRMYDYQAICQPEPPEPAPKKKCPVRKKKKPKNAGATLRTTFGQVYSNLGRVVNWTYGVVLYLINAVYAGPDYQSAKEDTLAFERLEIKKTFPTPCDKEMTLFNMRENFTSIINENVVKFQCKWPYVVRRIPNSNLLFMAINGACKLQTEKSISYGPEPTEILYKESLPCYIATFNNYSKRVYMNCYNRNKKEDPLNSKSRTYCGHTWK